MTDSDATAPADVTAEHAANTAELPIPETGRPLRDLRHWSRSYKQLWRKIRKPMRRHRGDVQVPQHTWRHADGRTIIMIGTMHTADPAFYQQIRGRIQQWEHDGARVYHELVTGPATPEQAATLSPLERQTLGLLAHSQQRQVDMAHAVGLVTQEEAFPLGTGWTRADVDVRDELPLFGYQKMILMLRRSLRTHVKLPRTDGERARKRRALRMTPVLYRLSMMGGRYKLMDHRVALDHRDILATQALLSAPAHTPVIGVWGASHLPGIGLYLWRAGFQLHDIDWLTVIAKHPERTAVQ